jgi:hypothetical protein
MGLDHSLITRALSGKPITAANGERIMSRMNRLQPAETPTIDVSLARELLHMMLRALDTYDGSGTVAGRRKRT